VSYEWLKRVQPKLGSIGERMVDNFNRQKPADADGISFELYRWVEMEMALLETATSEFERTGDKRWQTAGKGCWQMLSAVMDDVEQRQQR